jgi:hypothetical protein
MINLVTIFSSPGINAIGSTQVLPQPTDVADGTVHVSDGLDGLSAGQYTVHRGKWVFQPTTAAFVYFDGLLLRKATPTEVSDLSASKRPSLGLRHDGVMLTISDDPVTPESMAWMPTPKLTKDESRTLGKAKEAKIASLAKRQAKTDMESGANPMLFIPLQGLSDSANAERLTRWKTLRDEYEDAKTDALSDVVDFEEDGYVMNAAMRAWDHYYDLESMKLRR